MLRSVVEMLRILIVFDGFVSVNNYSYLVANLYIKTRSNTSLDELKKVLNNKAGKGGFD